MLHASTVALVRMHHNALQIKCHHQSDRFLPLRRLVELRLVGAIDLGGEVIPACLAAGISVQFLTDQAWIGAAYPTGELRAGATATLVDEFLALSDSRARLADYIAARRSRQALATSPRQAGERPAQHYQRITRALRSQLAPEPYRRIQSWAAIAARTAMLRQGYGIAHTRSRSAWPTLSDLVGGLVELPLLRRLAPHAPATTNASAAALDHWLAPYRSCIDHLIEAELRPFTDFLIESRSHRR